MTATEPDRAIAPGRYGMSGEVAGYKTRVGVTGSKAQEHTMRSQHERDAIKFVQSKGGNMQLSPDTARSVMVGIGQALGTSYEELCWRLAEYNRRLLSLPSEDP